MRLRPDDEETESELLLCEGVVKPRATAGMSSPPGGALTAGGEEAARPHAVARTPSDPSDRFMDEIRTSAHTDVSHLTDRSLGTTNFNMEEDGFTTNSAVGGSGAGVGSSANGGFDNLQENLGHYDDFHTIDWQRDLARDRLRHKMIVTRRQKNCWGWLYSIWDASSGWICVLMVGLAAGAVAGIIDIGTIWMSDLKDGICVHNFWLDREHCCWASNETLYTHFDCPSWSPWAAVLTIREVDSPIIFTLLSLLFYVCWAVGLAALCVTLVKVFAPYACGSGIPEIKCILSGFIIRGYLGKWTFIIKSVGLMLAAASGLSLGKEGPMVHLACCVGNVFSYLFPKYGKNEAKKREILSASAAAGVSVAFGAPIGGVLFSLEEASYYFPLKTMWRSFFCALIAGLILKLVNPFGSDQTSLFHVDYDMRWTFIELIPFSLLGLFGGLVGSLFIWANIKWCQYRKASRWLGRHPIKEVVVVAAVTALFSYFNPFTRISASQLIRDLFNQCGPEDHSLLCDYSHPTDAPIDTYESGDLGDGIKSAIWLLLLALIAKLIMTIFTFGIKVPAGLFVPSIAIGAIAGRLTGIAMEQIAYKYRANGDAWHWSCTAGKECVMPGLYAMVGAAAVLGGVTRMTVSLVVIMFELTGSLHFIVPTMAAVMFAKWIGDAIIPRGIYDAHIQLNAYPFLDNKEEFHLSTYAGDVMRPRPDAAPLRAITHDTMTVGDIEQLMSETEYNGFPVVTSADPDTQFLVGYVTRRDLQLAIEYARKTQDGIVTNSIVLFSSSTASPVPEVVGSAPVPLRLRKLMDMAPTTVTDKTPMETVADMFRKLGLRQTLVTNNGRVLGIITKKDVLRHMKLVEDADDSIPSPFAF